MKTLFVLASVVVILFLAAPNKIEAQKRKAASDNLEFLRKLDGGRGTRDDLLANRVIKRRLQNLLGKQRFEFMYWNWNLGGTDEKITNDVFVATGCMSHFCQDTNFIVVIDIANNKFYVGIRDRTKNNRIKTYSERGSNSSSQIQQRIQQWKDGSG